MVTPPMNMFALAISFRIDIFPKVQLSEIRQNTTTPGLERVGGSSNHIIQDFKDMNKTNMKLQQLNLVATHVVGWLAHNLTFNLALHECGGAANRLHKMREMIG
nr:uncharacterized protein LOC129384960 [Dermacentor andersoni]